MINVHLCPDVIYHCSTRLVEKKKYILQKINTATHVHSPTIIVDSSLKFDPIVIDVLLLIRGMNLFFNDVITNNHDKPEVFSLTTHA